MYIYKCTFFVLTSPDKTCKVFFKNKYEIKGQGYWSTPLPYTNVGFKHRGENMFSILYLKSDHMVHFSFICSS